MTTKKPKTTNKTSQAVTSLEDLKADPKNPRRMSERARAKLRGSLAKFGDLSGITFNRRTGELVTGHQRVGKIRELWPSAELVMAGEDAGVIAVDADRCFVVRIVDWTPSMQRAANVTANNQKIQGEFTEDVRQYLVDVHEALDAELPAIAERVRLLEWLTPDVEADSEQAVPSLFQVIASCHGEEEQQNLHAELQGRGLQATAVVG